MAILQINFRIDTAANWTTNNPTLLAGEPGYESDTGYLKIGDGTTNWVGLSYWGDFGGDLTLGGDLTISNVDPRILLEETGVTANNTKWDILLDAEQLQFRVLSDDEVTHADWLTVDRTANVTDLVAFTTTSLTTSGTLTVTGTMSAATGSTIGNLTLADGSITDSGGAISFGDENLSTTGTLASGALTVTGTATATSTIIAPAATTSISSVRMPHGAAPTTPTDGDWWTTTVGAYVRINGTTVGPLLDSASGGGVTKTGTPADDQVAVWTADGVIEGTTALTFTATQFTAGNYVFNRDQTVGAGQDQFVLTYDNASGEITLLENAGGGGAAAGSIFLLMGA